MAVLVTALRRAGLLDDATAPFVELFRAAPDGTVVAEPVEVRERPPMVTMSAYRERFSPPR